MKVVWAVVPKGQEEWSEQSSMQFTMEVPESELEGLGDNQRAAIVDDLVQEEFFEKCQFMWRKE